MVLDRRTSLGLYEVRGVGLGEGEGEAVGDGEDVGVGVVAVGVGVGVGVGEAAGPQPARRDTMIRINTSDKPKMENRLL